MEKEKSSEQLKSNDLEQEVKYLRSLVYAYENLSILREIEHRNAKSTIEAYEIISEFANMEKYEFKNTIKAYQSLEEFRDREKKDAESTISALEKVGELNREELKKYMENVGSFRRIDHPIQKEILDILDEDEENEHHILMKLNLLKLSRNDENFYSHLFNVLINLDFDEETARKSWDEIIALNRKVTEAIGRKISFRVSILDYFLDLNKHLRNPKIIEFKFFESTVASAVFDKLTGLLNRTYLNITINNSLRKAAKEGLKVGIIMFDVDNFKTFNDLFGHVEGDNLLRSLGMLLSAKFTGSNSAFRYGGEEFLCIVESKSDEEIFKIAEDVRLSLADQWRDSILPISLSGGYALYPDDDADMDELISKADKSLYDAKYSGKNMILRYSDNRRQNSRLVTTRTIAYSTGDDNSKQIKNAITVNMSQTGLSIETDENLPLNRKISIYFDPKTCNTALCVEGVVCWIEEKEQKKSYIAGIEFNKKF